MATRSLGSTSLRPRNPTDFLGDVAGATLDNSWTVQLNFDDAVYGATNEGKQRLITALMALTDKIMSVKSWPIGPAS
jgi:hypothetical protein